MTILYLAVIFFVVTFYHIFWKGYLALRCRYQQSMLLKLLSKLRGFDLTGDDFFSVDSCPTSILEKRRLGYMALQDHFLKLLVEQPEKSNFSFFADERFGLTLDVPFLFKKQVNRDFFIPKYFDNAKGPYLINKDRNFLDLSGSFGLNVFGFDVYKSFLVNAAKDTHLYPSVGVLNDKTIENSKNLLKISNQEKITYHMSGTEAVMAAIKMVRFSTNRKYIIIFRGSYHGWWPDLMQLSPKLGKNKVEILKDLSQESLKYIDFEGLKIAGVMLNPMQMFFVNKFPASDGALFGKRTNISEDYFEKYKQYLTTLRKICADLEIPLIFDEVSSGFKLALGGAQEYFGIQADIVIYGKTIGGGSPVGIVCGKSKYMKTHDEEHPFCHAGIQGTFSCSPLTVNIMHENLKYILDNEKHIRAQMVEKDELFRNWIKTMNEKLAKYPIVLRGFSNLFTFDFLANSRYNWMLQIYLAKNGINLIWSGTGRCFLNFSYDQSTLDELSNRILLSCSEMQECGFFWTNNSKYANLKYIFTITRQIISSTIFGTIKNVTEEVAKHRRIDDEVSHTNPVNQFLHWISSIVMILAFIVVLITQNYFVSLLLFIVSQIIRQCGHFFFEKTKAGVDRAKIGFRAGLKKVLLSVLILGIISWRLFIPEISFSAFFLLFFLALVLGKALSIFYKSNLKLAVVWFLKLISDPFTNIISYRKLIPIVFDKCFKNK